MLLFLGFHPQALGHPREGGRFLGSEELHFPEQKPRNSEKLTRSPRAHSRSRAKERLKGGFPKLEMLGPYLPLIVWGKTERRAEEEKPFRGLRGQHWLEAHLESFICKTQALIVSLC